MTRLAILIGLLAGWAYTQSPPAVQINPTDTGFDIHVGDQLFTRYHAAYKGITKPILYPLIGPSGAQLLRHYPMRKGVPDEASDHPHHTGIFYTHGNVNGVNFWHVGARNQGFIKQQHAAIKGNSLLTRNHWTDAAGKLILRDQTRYTFSVTASGARAIDIQLTLQASEGDVTFHDDKEGSMGIRTHPALRLKGSVARGEAVNSEGVRGKAIWGKRASWVNYTGPIDGKPNGIAIMDHPDNPRHPTTWHARDYGLITANPFGLSHFLKQHNPNGDFTIRQDDAATFTYRFLFHQGEDIDMAYKAWTQ